MQTKNPSIIALSTASAVSVTGLAFISPVILLIKDHYNVSSNEVQLTIEELKSWLTLLNLRFLGFVNLSETTKCNFFQKFGTEYGQFIFPKHFPEIFNDIDEREFWVKRFKIWYDIEKDCDRLLKVVINDLRFIHEYEYLLKMDAYVIKIERDGVLKDNHISENELSNNINFN